MSIKTLGSSEEFSNLILGSFMDEIYIDRPSADAREALSATRRSIIQDKLMFILDKYHVSKDAGYDVGYDVSIKHWLTCHAKEFANEFESARTDVMEVCDKLCGDSCGMKTFRIKDIVKNPSLLDMCPFDFDLLHVLLHDGYPVNNAAAYTRYEHITGHAYDAGK